VNAVEPMRPLFDASSPSTRLPPRLAELYGGDLELPRELLYANFVSSLDGVAALPVPARSGALLSGRNPADRFLMGLLRALSDAVVVGAGTLRAEPGHLWTPAYVSRSLASAFSELRRPDPRTVVVSASGHLEPGEPALERGALVLTTDAGAAALAGRLPRASSLRSLGPETPRGAAILEAVRSEGHRRVLTEGGPTLMAAFMEDRLVDELFLTLSPLFAGRRSGDGRLGLLEGVELLPGDPAWARLVSLRTHGSHLFLRYAFSRSGDE
jgi:riboflavin biosynthesis pyrimidine reductase